MPVNLKALLRSLKQMRVAWWLGLAVAGLFLRCSWMVGLRIQQLQAQVDGRSALAAAESELLAAAARSEREIRAALVRLTQDRRLGFNYLEWRSPQGLLLGRSGVYEGLKLPLLAPDYSQQLQDWLQQRGEHRGVLRLAHGSEVLGQMLYVRSDDWSALAADPGLQAARWLVWISGLLSLAWLGLAALQLRGEQNSPALLAMRAQGRTVAPADRSAVQDAGTQEQALCAALNQAGLGLIVSDQQHRIVEMNDAAAQITGWPAAEALGVLIYSVLHPLGDDEQPLKTPAESALSMGHKQLTCSLRTRGGGLRPVQIWASVTPGAAAMVNTILVPTAAESGLLRARRTEAVLDQLELCLLVIDPQGRILMANARASALFGYRRVELLGMVVTKLLPVPFLKQAAVSFADYLPPQAAGLPPVVGWRKDASTVELQLQVRRLEDGPEQQLLLLLSENSN